MTNHPIENFDVDPFDDLDDYLSGLEPDWDSDPEPPPDIHRAEQLVARLGRLDRTRARSRSAAEERMRQIVEWQAEREGVWLRQETWLEGALARYHEAVLSLDSSATTLHLPSGDLVSRKQQPEWDVDNEAAVIGFVVPPSALERIGALRAEFLAAVDEVLAERAIEPEAVAAVKVAPPGSVEVSKSGLKKYATQRDEKGKPVAHGVRPSTGEPIPGVTVTHPGRKYTVVLRNHTDDDGGFFDGE